MPIHRGVVVDHEFQESQNSIPFLQFRFAILPEASQIVFCSVYISEKSAGMARRALSLLDLDVDKRSVSELDENKTLLAGKVADIEETTEAFGGKMVTKFNILLGASKLVKEKLSALDNLLRGAKKKPELVPSDAAPKPTIIAAPSRAPIQKTLPGPRPIVAPDRKDLI